MECLNMDFDDTCELFFSLDEEEIADLHCDSDGECELDSTCPYYEPVWED